MFKKFLAVALSATMALSFVGCGSSKDSKGIATDYGTVSLADYKGLVVYEDDIAVTDKEVQSSIDSDLSSHSTTKTEKKGTVKDDSSVVFDFEGQIEVNGKKVVFDGGSAQDQTADMATSTVGGSPMIDGFVAALKGHKVGDKFTKKLKFPSDYGKSTKIDGKDVDLSGKDVWFTFTVKSLQKTIKPELNDKFVKENYSTEKLTTVSEYKDYLKKNLRNNKIMNGVWESYVDKCKVTKYNDKSITEYESLFESFIQSKYSTDLKSYKEACSMSDKDWDDGVKKAMKAKMIPFAILTKEGVDFDKIYAEKTKELAKQYSTEVESLEAQYDSYYGASYGTDSLKYVVAMQQIIDIIADNVKVEKGSAPTTEPASTEAATTAEATTAEETTAK